MNIYVYHNKRLLYNGPAPRGVGMLEFVPGCVADTCGDIDLTRYEVKRIGFTLNGAPVIYVQERPERESNLVNAIRREAIGEWTNLDLGLER